MYESISCLYVAVNHADRRDQRLRGMHDLYSARSHTDKYGDEPIVGVATRTSRWKMEHDGKKPPSLKSRKKLYKQRKRSGRFRGVKERLAEKVIKLNAEIASSNLALDEAEKERRYWEDKFIDLERYRVS